MCPPQGTVAFGGRRGTPPVGSAVAALGGCRSVGVGRVGSATPHGTRSLFPDPNVAYRQRCGAVLDGVPLGGERVGVLVAGNEPLGQSPEVEPAPRDALEIDDRSLLWSRTETVYRAHGSPLAATST